MKEGCPAEYGAENENGQALTVGLEEYDCSTVVGADGFVHSETVTDGVFGTKVEAIFNNTDKSNEHLEELTSGANNHNILEASTDGRSTLPSAATITALRTSHRTHKRSTETR
ncbi:MAG: hypothetical protein LBP35_02085 [Candidatus Ancillula trichonymphae]|nr:hypothetical protein [Candidatus Ancillula trichonymphae]